MEDLQFFEEYVIGSRRQSFGRTITEADIVFHAGHSGDFFPHHMDAEFAREQPFGQRIAHGTMTFTIGIGLTAQSVNPAALTYGYDRLRFPKPVFAGDTLRSSVTVARKEDHPARPKFGKVVEIVETVNQRKETVLYCEHVILVERRSTSTLKKTL